MNLTSAVSYFPLNSMLPNSPLSTARHLILEHFFFSSSGYALVLDRQSPLWLSLVPATTNSQNAKLCIKTDATRSPYNNSRANTTEVNSIRFSVYASRNIRSLYDALSGNSLGGAFQVISRPSTLPAPQLLSYPSWLVTAGRSKFFAEESDFNTEKVIQFSEVLKQNGYLHNLIMLDSGWQWDVARPGNPWASFYKGAFSNPKWLTTRVHDNTQKLGLLIEPYLSTLGWDFKDHRDFFVKSKANAGGKFTAAAEGPLKDRALFDVTNEAAVRFMADRVNSLVKENEVDFLELASIRTALDGAVVQLNRSEEVPGSGSSTLFSQRYLLHLSTALNQAAGRPITTIVQEGHETQALSSFVRISPRTSDWAGLRSVIPTVLSLSIAGYSFILPDIVGGSVPVKSATNQENGIYPFFFTERELFIRWTQAVAFMPALQFATPPWEYDDGPNVPEKNKDTANLVQKVLAKRVLLARDLLVRLANLRQQSGAPIIRPLWYRWPEDEHAYLIDDQFMVGDALLVAPVLERGATGRSVYLPRGKWKAEQGQAGQVEHMGPVTVWVDAPLEVVPCFTLII